MIKQKKEQIKPALIMCAVLGVIILIVFAAAYNTNNKVVEDMKGKVLFYGDGLRLYDFDEKKLTEIAGDTCFDGQFADDGRIVYADSERNCITEYDMAQGKETLTVNAEGGQIKGLSYSREQKTAAAIVEKDDNYSIISYSGENYADVKEVVKSDVEICGMDFSDDGSRIYYTEYDGKNGCMRSVPVSGGTPDKKLEGNGEKLSEICVRGSFVYICEEKSGDSDIIKYSEKAGRATVPKFNSDDCNCTSLVTVSDEEYIVVSDNDGKKSLYVCNGSNMKVVENAGSYGSLKVNDYNVKTD